MSLEVGGEDRFDDDEPEALEVGVVEVGEPREARVVGLHEAPGGRRVVVLQHRPVVVQHRLAQHITHGWTLSVINWTGSVCDHHMLS